MTRVAITVYVMGVIGGERWLKKARRNEALQMTENELRRL